MARSALKSGSRLSSLMPFQTMSHEQMRLVQHRTMYRGSCITERCNARGISSRVLSVCSASHGTARVSSTPLRVSHVAHSLRVAPRRIRRAPLAGRGLRPLQRRQHRGVLLPAAARPRRASRGRPARRGAGRRGAGIQRVQRRHHARLLAVLASRPAARPGPRRARPAARRTAGQPRPARRRPCRAAERLGCRARVQRPRRSAGRAARGRGPGRRRGRGVHRRRQGGLRGRKRGGRQRHRRGPVAAAVRVVALLEPHARLRQARRHTLPGRARSCCLHARLVAAQDDGALWSFSGGRRRAAPTAGGFAGARLQVPQRRRRRWTRHWGQDKGRLGIGWVWERGWEPGAPAGPRHRRRR